MGLKKLLLLCALFLGLTACSQPARYVSKETRPATVVRIWLDPASGLPIKETLEGCNMWNVMDVQCVAVEDAKAADITISEDGLFCGVNKEGTRTLAYAYPDSSIKVRKDCFYSIGIFKDTFRDKMYKLMIAHEVGHVFGIWTHVEKECDEDGKKAAADAAHDVIPALGPPAKKICGEGIMNPIIDEDIDYLTVHDKEAFDHRNRQYSALEPRMSSGPREPPPPVECVGRL